MIRKHRLARGWKQQTLAVKAGITQNYVSSIESGSRVGTLDKLQAIADALEIPLSTIVDTSPELPGLEAMPASFARVVDRHGKKLSPRQWELAVSFFEWLAAQGPEEPAAYGYKAPEGANGQDDQKVVGQETGS